MHDTLEYFRNDPIHRRHHQGELTFRAVYAFTENFMLPLSHDEVVHGKGSLYAKMPGDQWQQFANLRLLYGYMFAQPGKKLLFMGDEFGQQAEWNHEQSLDWHLLDAPLQRGAAAVRRRPQPHLPRRAGAARARRRPHRLRVGRRRRQRVERPQLPPPRRERRHDPVRVQLHAGAPHELPHRRAARGDVARARELRRRPLRRQRPGQPRRRRGHARAHARPPVIAAPDAAAAGRRPAAPRGADILELDARSERPASTRSASRSGSGRRARSASDLHLLEPRPGDPDAARRARLLRRDGAGRRRHRLRLPAGRRRRPARPRIPLAALRRPRAVRGGRPGRLRLERRRLPGAGAAGARDLRAARRHVHRGRDVRRARSRAWTTSSSSASRPSS